LLKRSLLINEDSIKRESRLIFIILFSILFYNILSNFITVSAESNNEYMGAVYCVECHPSQIQEWIYSAHTRGYSNSEFQQVWEDLGRNIQCLECHTTGYDSNSETFELLEVQCEECHGPEDTMNKDTSPELCGKCHSGPYPTYEEWVDSGPSHGEAECSTCHNEHTLGFVLQTPAETCGQCHESHVEELEDTLHELNGVDCVVCHMIIEEADFYSGKTAKTGHSFNPLEQEFDCQYCHAIELVKHNTLGEGALACLNCHGDIHELRLELINGEIYPIDESVPLCAQCHNERYTAWEEGTHGAHDNPEAECAECHEPHNPIIHNISTLAPIPNREPAETLRWSTKISLLIILGILAFSVLIFRSGK
jgi:hypothetical protein